MTYEQTLLMNTCKNCKTEYQAEEAVCVTCRYPLGGSEDEQAVFVANQVLQKSYVSGSIERLKKARNILFVLGVCHAVFAFVPVFSPTGIDMGLNLFFGILFGSFGFLTYRNPKIALLVPLLFMSCYYLLLLSFQPLLFISGAIWKILILSGLGYGYFSVRKSDRILKENEYLAGLLGFNRITNK